MIAPEDIRERSWAGAYGWQLVILACWAANFFDLYLPALIHPIGHSDRAWACCVYAIGILIVADTVHSIVARYRARRPSEPACGCDTMCDQHGCQCACHEAQPVPFMPPSDPTTEFYVPPGRPE